MERWSDKVSVIRLGDDPQFTDDLVSIEQAGTPPDTVLDFTGVHFVNSSNIAKLLRLRKLMTATQRRLVLCNINTQVWGAFLTTGLDKIFSFSADVATALATLEMA